jgi:nucleotide-binding universal stress UspA family protein
MAVSLPIEDVASAADIMFLLLFLQVNIAMIRLRKMRPDLDRGFVAPLYPWLSIIGILMLLFLAIYMFNYSFIAWVVTAVWVAVGLTTYRFYAANREVAHARKISALTSLEQKQFRILACLSSPKSASSLTHIAIAIARKHGSEIKFLHVVEAQEGQKLSAGVAEADRIVPLLDSAISLAASEKIPASTIIQVSHRVSHGIIEAADEEYCNLLIVGRQKEPDFLDRVFSSLVDTVLRQSTSEVAILHGTFAKNRMNKIVLPLGANIHTRLAVEMAPALVRYFGATLHVIQVVDAAEELPQQTRLLEDARRDLGTSGISALYHSVHGKSVVSAIVEASRDADLLLMGGRSGDFFELLLAKSLSQEITLRASCPVLWVREYEEQRSFWRSLWNPTNVEVDSHA